jgi:hypothetical protein
MRTDAKHFGMTNESKTSTATHEQGTQEEESATSGSNIQRAALLLKDVVAGRATNIWLLRTANKKSIWLFFFRRKVWRPVVLLSCFSLVALAIHPNLPVEVLCLLVLVVDMLIEATYLSAALAFWQTPSILVRYFSKYHRGYNQRRVFAALTIVLWVSLLLRVGIADVSSKLPKYFAVVAPLLIITQFVSLRRLIKLLMFTLIKSKDILFFLACVLLLSSILGVLALGNCSFEQSGSTPSVSFQQLSEALISSFVLTGSDNLQFFIEHSCGKFSWAYFATFTIFVQMLILNMLMVSFYDAYKQFLVSTIEKTWGEELEALSTVFVLASSYAVGNEDIRMSFDDWKSLMRAYDKHKPRDLVTDQFKDISRNQGHIDVTDFVGVLDILLLSFKKEQIKPRGRLSHYLLMTYKTESKTGTMGSGKRLQWRPAAQLLVHALLALHIGFACTMRGSESGSSGFSDGIGFGFLLAHILEQGFKACLTNNVGLFLKNNKLDATIISIAIVLVLPCAFVSELKWGSRIGTTFPILRLLTVFTKLKRILLDVFRIVIPLTSFLSLLVLSFFFFALFGHAIFEEDEHFSSFGKSMLTLFLLFQQEQTSQIIDSVLISKGNFYWVWYFVVFQFVTVWLISNTFVGIVFHHFQHRHQFEDDDYAMDGESDSGDNYDRASGFSVQSTNAFTPGRIVDGEAHRLSNSSVCSELAPAELSPTELVLAEKLSAGLISQGEYDKLVEQHRMANAFTMDLNEKDRVNVFKAKLKAGKITEEEYHRMVQFDKNNATDIMEPDHALEDRRSEYGGGKKHTRLRKKRTMRATARNMEKQLLKIEKQLPSTRDVEKQLLSGMHRNVDLSSRRSVLTKTARASVRRISRPSPPDSMRRLGNTRNPMVSGDREGIELTAPLGSPARLGRLSEI